MMTPLQPFAPMSCQEGSNKCWFLGVLGQRTQLINEDCKNQWSQKLIQNIKVNSVKQQQQSHMWVKDTPDATVVSFKR